MLAQLAAALVTLVLATPSFAAQCGGDFQTFIATISREAASQGVSRQVIDQAFAGVAIDPNVLSFDRRQRGTFRKSFEEYAATRVTQGRINRARQLLQRHAALLSRVERQFGRAEGDDRRDLGSGERFRRGRHRQDAGGAHPRDAGARLPPHRAVPEGAASLR